MKETVLLFLRGFVMGIADTIPGVSGGTIAFLTGIYDRLIRSLKNLTHFIVDWKFLTPIVLGIGSAIFLFSKVIQTLLQTQPAITFAFFFGLITASALLLWKKREKFTLKSSLFLILGFIIAYVLAGAAIIQLSHSLPTIFVSGMLAIIAMLLPGISGAFVLLLLNQYSFLIDALHSYNFPVLFSAATGALVGLAISSHLISFLLRTFKALTLSFLLGLMVGSLRIPVLRISEAGGLTRSALIAGVIGFVMVLALERLFQEKH